MWSNFWKWVVNLVDSTGIWEQTYRLLFVGLDNSGKSSLLCRLKNADEELEKVSFSSSNRFENILFDQFNFEIIDLKGHSQARHTWPNYFFDIDAIVYFIDASDTKRFFGRTRQLGSSLSHEINV